MRLQGAAVAVGAMGAATVTVGAGAPPVLPDVALSSVVLFHLERAGALLAAAVFLVVILARAWRGELPSEMSSQGIKYSAEQAKDATEQILVAIAEDVKRLKARMDDIEGRE